MAYLPPYAHFYEPFSQNYVHGPAEYIREPGIPKGWYQDGRRLRNVKTSKAFIWPKDGKNGNKRGRFKDILTNKGPDIYVSVAARKGDWFANRPTRGQWTGHKDLDPRIPVHLFSQPSALDFRRGMLGGEAPGHVYDFRTRKYGMPHRSMWTDAVWHPEHDQKSKTNNYPEAFRSADGTWYQDFQYLPQIFGGPVNNEYGNGGLNMHLPDLFI